MIFSPLQSDSQIVIAEENEAYFIKVARNHRELSSSALLNCNVVPRIAGGEISRIWGETAATLGAGGGVKNLQVLITSVAAGHGADTTQADFLTIKSKRHSVAFVLIWPILNAHRVTFKGHYCQEIE